jgi:hypothetical protein
MVWWRTGSYTYYLFEEDATHFHQTVKRLATNIIGVYQNIKNNVMPISGTRIAMKRGMEVCFRLL